MLAICFRIVGTLLLLQALLLQDSCAQQLRDTGTTVVKTITEPDSGFQPYDNKRPRVTGWSILMGYSFSSADYWGKTPNARFGQVGFRFERKILQLSEHVFEYTADLNLLASYTYPSYTFAGTEETLTGFGLTPLGIQFNLNGDRIIQPYLRTSSGFLYLESPFPDQRGTRLNFTFEAGAGLEMFVLDNASLKMGYSYHHLSNGETGEVNPGIDSNLIYIGFTVY